MAYTNSSLVCYTKISPNRTQNRTHAIDTITIHCVVGQCSVETLGSVFAPTSRQASSNYGIGPDGRIGMYVEEKDRSWCSSNATNDHRAITIEVASDTTSPYAVTDKAYNALIELCADICKRNGIKKLVWSTSKSDRVNHKNGCNMTCHRDFANKSCPGDYLYSREGDIASKVNAKLGSSTTTSTTTTSTATLYRVRKTWADSKTQLGAYKSLSNAKKKADENAGYSVFDANGNCVYTGKNTSTSTTSSSFTAYKVKVTADCLRIRKGAGTNYAVTGTITDKGVYTITAESSGTGANKWGKLKSGIGWIALDYTKKV